MNVDISIDADAVQKAIVDAVINSAIGKQIEKAITDAFRMTTDGSFNYTNVVQKAVDNEIHKIIRETIFEKLESSKSVIQEAVAKAMPDEYIEQLAHKAWQALGRI